MLNGSDNATLDFVRPACGSWRLHVNSRRPCAICGVLIPA
jgi:hypothetical protein